jgi:hypothetical protein
MIMHARAVGAAAGPGRQARQDATGRCVAAIPEDAVRRGGVSPTNRSTHHTAAPIFSLVRIVRRGACRLVQLRIIVGQPASAPGLIPHLRSCNAATPPIHFRRKQLIRAKPSD